MKSQGHSFASCADPVCFKCTTRRFQVACDHGLIPIEVQDVYVSLHCLLLKQGILINQWALEFAKAKEAGDAERTANLRSSLVLSRQLLDRRKEQFRLLCETVHRQWEQVLENSPRSLVDDVELQHKRREHLQQLCQNAHLHAITHTWKRESQAWRKTSST